MDKLRIGVIGLGWFGEIQCEAIVGIPNLELAALCTRTPERLKAMATKFGVAKAMHDYRDVLADPSIDAVSIVTMWDQHTEPAIDALAAGKHVFLESPSLRRWRTPRKSSPPPSAPKWNPPSRTHLPVQPPLSDGQAGDRCGRDRPNRPRRVRVETSRPPGRRKF